MLTEKYKSVVERIAVELQKEFIIKESKEIKYDFNRLITFLKDMGCVFRFNSNCNEVESDNMHLAFEESEINSSENRKIFFHETWHFMAFKLGLFENSKAGFEESYSTELSEMTAGYFSRAMNMPENRFINCAILNTDLKGNCNIFEVAKFFKVDFTDVIGRGNDLNLWNRKVGL